MEKRNLNRLFFEISPVLGYVGVILTFLSVFFLLPLIIDIIYFGELINTETFMFPAAISFILGILLKWRKPLGRINHKQGMLVASLAWIFISLLGALPYKLGFGASFVDSFFESVSGFTTTGITMFKSLDFKSRSILFYRAMTQWVGGLGILSFALLIVYEGGVAPQLFTGESHKIRTKRISPGLFNTIRSLWFIYGLITVSLIILLKIEGVSIFDAVTHSFTTVSTGGFSPHDSSIGYYSIMGYKNYKIIEWTIILFMIMGGVNFLIHYRMLQGDLRAFWDNFEMKLFWTIIAVSTGFVVLEQFLRTGIYDLNLLRSSLFQTVAIMTTTGYATQDIGSPIFLGVSRQIFLALMVIGGCVGSTGGGVKVMRIGVLFKLIRVKIFSIIRPQGSVNFVKVDGNRIDEDEVKRVASLFAAWIFLLLAGGLITALFSSQGALESLSGMASALGNVGPCYISVSEMIGLNPIIKITYAIGMLAGRLEIFPILMLFYRNTWR